MSSQSDSKMEEKSNANGINNIPITKEEFPPSNLRATIKCYSALKHEKISYNIRLHQITTKTIKFLFQLPNDANFFLCDNDNNVELCNDYGQFMMCDENGKYNVEIVNKSPNDLNKAINSSKINEEQKKDISNNINNNNVSNKQEKQVSSSSITSNTTNNDTNTQQPPPSYNAQLFPYKDQYGRPCDQNGRTPSGIQILVDSKGKECKRDPKTGQIKYYRVELHGKEKWLFDPDTNQRLQY